MGNQGLNSFRSRRKFRRQRGKNFKYLIFFIAIGFVFYFVNRWSEGEKSSQDVAGLTAPEVVIHQQPESSSVPSSSPQVSYKSLQETIEKSLEGTAGSYGVVVKNLKTGESYTLNENKTFEAGSLYKLWTMAAVFEQIEKGELSEDEELSQGIAVLNRKFGISPEYAEQTRGTITLSVRDALKQMITISHNYAALLLTEKIKLSTVATWLGEKSFNNSKVGTDGAAPQTTPLDVALFFEKLYKGELASNDSTAKMLELLKNQQLRNKLPKNLDPSVEIAHKTGEIGWFSHDAGIVYSEKGDYIIAVLSESSSPKGAEERIAQLSQDVFNYFKNKK